MSEDPSKKEPSQTFPVAKVQSASLLGLLRGRGARWWFLSILCLLVAVTITWLSVASRGVLLSVRFLEGHGLKPGDYWERGAGPEEWQELQADFDAELDQVMAGLMTEFSETDMAELYRSDRAEFDHICKAARR